LSPVEVEPSFASETTTGRVACRCLYLRTASTETEVPALSRLTDLLRQVEQNDPHLASDLRTELKMLRDRRAFGLNFERHTPETVELPGRAVRKGDKVRFLAERGASESSVDRRLWRVVSVSRTDAGRVANLRRQDPHDHAAEATSRLTDDLVVVAEFRDPIYPGLRSTGRIEQGDDKPFHTVINAESFHALQSLLYTHQGKVDAIYIDPPYNTGAKDWKYNNNYVDADDAYRHSKWLAFMDRRLKLAKRLLNPEHSVLIVTIDEKEYLRLGLLLEQVFPGVSKQMVTVVINPNGVARGAEMARVEEYAYFLFLGSAGPALVFDSLLDTGDRERPKRTSVRWEWLLRGGPNSRRQDRPNLFYAVFVDPETRTVAAVGEPLGLTEPRTSVPDRDGLVTVWPLRTDGAEGRWRASAEYVTALLEQGYARVGAYDAKADRWSILYLGRAQIRRIEAGEIAVLGTREGGSVILEEVVGARRTPKTVWNRSAHTAGEHGSALLKKFVGNRGFPFPKSLYAVEDALRIAVQDKSDAVVVDFLSGSGTTAHAVMRLNKHDGGRRQSISVTNNEVSAEEQTGLRQKGLRPGDPEWEALGICDHITKPRLMAAVTGVTPAGQPVKGDYKFTDETPMSDGFEENVEFFTMSYEAPLMVAHNRSFEAVAPLLWLKAGSQGRRIETVTDDFDVADTYGILFDLDHSHDFLAAVQEAESLRMVFVVTDDDRSYQMVCSELPVHVEPVRLYESYLTNFSINRNSE
jgi:adenine-specific DNA-methyltransferase